MSKVYRAGSYHGTEYFNTAKDVNRYKPGGEHPESVECFDAAEECNRLQRGADEDERVIGNLRRMLEELRDVCLGYTLEDTEIGRRVTRFLEENPKPPADGADRQPVGRSYGV